LADKTLNPSKLERQKIGNLINQIYKSEGITNNDLSKIQAVKQLKNFLNQKMQN
jgi:hypothetical protein